MRVFSSPTSRLANPNHDNARAVFGLVWRTQGRAPLRATSPIRLFEISQIGPIYDLENVLLLRIRYSKVSLHDDARISPSTMDSDSIPLSGEPGAQPASSTEDAVDLQILSPSLESPQRFTLNDLPLATKVSEVKARITLAIPSRPDPETQRLIYKGRVLSNNDELLRNIIDQPAVSTLKRAFCHG